MRRGILCLTLCGTWLAAQAGYADPAQKYFPLKKGNLWAYESDPPGFGEQTLVGKTKGDAFHLQGFPGTSDGMWVKPIGHTLYAWKTAQKQWGAFLRFNAPTLSSYSIHLNSDFFEDANVLLKSKNVTVKKTLLDQSFPKCSHFDIWDTIGGGQMQFFFAPYVGLVKWTNEEMATETYLLKSAVVGGKKLGYLSFSNLGSGTSANFFVPGSKKVLLLNSTAAWKDLYSKHNPGAPVPSIDFKKKTVLLAWAGSRQSTGYEVHVGKVKWNYPKSSAHVTVDEIKPISNIVWVKTRPYRIVLLDEKVYSVTVQWNVTSLGLPTPVLPEPVSPN